MTEDTITIKNGKQVKIWTGIISAVIIATVAVLALWGDVGKRLTTGETERATISRDIARMDNSGTHLSQSIKTECAVLKTRMENVNAIVCSNSAKLDKLLLREK